MAEEGRSWVSPRKSYSCCQGDLIIRFERPESFCHDGPAVGQETGGNILDHPRVPAEVEQRVRLRQAPAVEVLLDEEIDTANGSSPARIPLGPGSADAADEVDQIRVPAAQVQELSVVDELVAVTGALQDEEAARVQSVPAAFSIVDELPNHAHVGRNARHGSHHHVVCHTRPPSESAFRFRPHREDISYMLSVKKRCQAAAMLRSHIFDEQLYVGLVRRRDDGIRPLDSARSDSDVLTRREVKRHARFQPEQKQVVSAVLAANDSRGRQTAHTKASLKQLQHNKAEHPVRDLRARRSDLVQPTVRFRDPRRRRILNTLFLCGDVMTGRGVDQIQAHPCPPQIQEPHVRDARDYVALAEEANGQFRWPVPQSYIWGDALHELERVAPDVRIINLETSITTSEAFWPGKGIHYRMHPRNVGCLTAAGVDVCVLANNHVIDYGRAGLEETLATLADVGLKVTGAGSSIHQAREPAIVDARDGGRILVFAVGAEDSGIAKAWAASLASSGVDLLPDLTDATADDLVTRVRSHKRRGDVAVVSIHWGDNWGYDVPGAHIRFAHRLVDGGIDLVHGHSSHHPRPIEIYRDKLVLYGCGDFITDYEGIAGYEQFRDDLVVMYFPRLDPNTGDLVTLHMTPLQIRRMQLVRPSAKDRDWLLARLADVSIGFGCDVTAAPGDGTYEVRRSSNRIVWLSRSQPGRTKTLRSSCT